MTSWWEKYGKLWAYLKKGQQDTSRSQQKVPSILFSFFLPFFSFSNSFPIPFVFSFFCRNVRSAWRAMLSGVSQSRRSWDGWPRRRIRNASCTIPIYPSGIGFCAMSAMSAMSCESVLWLLRAHLVMSGKMLPAMLSTYVNMGMIFSANVSTTCSVHHNMSYKTMRNVLYLLGITTESECVELPLVWTLDHAVHMDLSAFLNFMNKTHPSMILWVQIQNLHSLDLDLLQRHSRAGTKQLCDPTRIVHYCLLFRSNRDILCWRCCQRVIHKHLTFAV